jgi:hypothetical protein
LLPSAATDIHLDAAGEARLHRDQDRPIAESQRPEALPIDLSEELHIAGPDKASIAYRRRLAELAASEAATL